LSVLTFSSTLTPPAPGVPSHRLDGFRRIEADLEEPDQSLGCAPT
jgi:hypothetical protein